MISSEPHTVFHIYCPGHHFNKDSPYRVLLDAEPLTTQAGSLENWQINDRSWEDKESALFYWKRGSLFHFFFVANNAARGKRNVN